MKILLILFTLSALSSAFVLWRLKRLSRFDTLNRRRQPDLDLQRIWKENAAHEESRLRARQTGRVIFRNLTSHSQPNGKYQHERNKLP